MHCCNVSYRVVSPRAGAARCDLGILHQRRLERLVLPLSPAVHGEHVRPDRSARLLRRVRPRALPPKGDLGERGSIFVLFPGATQALAPVKRHHCTNSIAQRPTRDKFRIQLCVV